VSRVELNAFIEAVCAAAPEIGELRADDYIAAGVKNIVKTDLPHVVQRSNQHHIALSDIKGTMRLFPLVTSPLYENSRRKGEGVDTAEKQFYVNTVKFRGYRANLVHKLQECRIRPDGYFKYSRADLDSMTNEAQAWPDVFDGSVTAVAQIRESEQLQLELSRSDDSAQWKVLHKSLDAGDWLAILQRPNMTYDFIVLPAAAVINKLDEHQRKTLEDGVQAPADTMLRVATFAHTHAGAGTDSSAGGSGASIISKVVEACRSFGQSHFIVLWGVPATGKSFIAEQAARQVAGNPARIRICQFHPSYSYSDLFEGYSPNEKGGFDPRQGLLSTINDLALGDRANTYVLLIEEFSRADVPAVIGELLTHVEYRERKFITPFGKEMQLAPNLVFIGTMNPQDRSALELDDAILRRFRTIKIVPTGEQAEAILRQTLDSKGCTAEEESLIAGVRRLFTETQAAHADEYPEQMPFGPWIFKSVRNWRDLDLLWEQQVEQLIRRPGGTRHPFYETIARLRPKPPSDLGNSREPVRDDNASSESDRD
jgi:5-methylcytosine-specific restriction protein B